MLLRILVLAMLNNFALSTASAQSRYRSGPLTVVDYYMLLPDKYFEANRQQRRRWMLDPQRGAIVDVANGYLYAVGDGAQTDIYTRLFKKSNGTYLIAVGYNDKDQVFETFLDFFVYEHGRLRKVTKNVLPIRFNKALFYLLPRQGTTINVTNASGKKMYELVWVGSVFRLKRV